MIDQMRQRTLEAMSAKTRRLYEAYLESQRLDEVVARRQGE